MPAYRKLTVFTLLAAICANGCANMNHTERDAAGGAAGGAVLGALLDRRHPGTGAAVGGIAGGVIGAAVGSETDSQERRVKAIAAAEAQPVRGPLSLEEVSDLARRGISDDVIRNQIRGSGTIYNLSPAQITWLHDNGVSDPVIAEMQQTRFYRPRRVYMDDPVYVAPRPVVYGPSFGFGYYHYR